MLKQFTSETRAPSALIRAWKLSYPSVRTAKKLITFDFDGVIADSEMLANTVLDEFVTKLGLPTTPDDALSLLWESAIST